MKCANHPEKEVIKNCGFCNKGFCKDCLIELGDNYFCKSCLAEKSGINISDNVNHEQKVKTVVSEKKSKLWAFLFSLVPGVGYLYLGLMTRGLHTMILFFGSIFVASFIGFDQLMALVVPVVVFYSVFDTQQLVKNLNEGMEVEDKQLFDIKKIPFNQSWIGYTLIFIGIMALLNNVLPFYYPVFHAVQRILPPVLIIGLGVLILYRNTRNPY